MKRRSPEEQIIGALRQQEAGAQVREITRRPVARACARGATAPLPRRQQAGRSRGHSSASGTVPS